MRSAPMPALVGHRGLPTLAPENTAASIRSAVEQGIEWLELDVTMAGDGSLIVMHDPDCRLFGEPDIKLADLNKTALQKIDAGAWFDEKFTGEPILFCDEMLSLIRQTGAHLNLEIKINPDLDIVRQVDNIWAELTQASDLFDRLLISSFSIQALEHLRTLNQSLKIGVLYEAVPDDAIDTTKQLQATTIHCNQGLLEQETAKHLIAHLPVYCYTVNDTETLEKLLSWGISGVFSDRAHASDLKEIVDKYS
ncbi:glycerophosphodiester phosphodiesterase family protein [Reinekea sp.]|jgi:glycerophosphoryl diester phosphodiesterase|uniref:glycerophosphodiester phosphodiesterase family protein n=1 Tax=Reinekea sp. TaxID=1970455 RepID=UPI003988F779